MRRIKTWRGVFARWLAVSAVACVASAARAQTAAWFGGGSYDGYDKRSAQQPIGSPYADNADGATNVLPGSACLNGRLAATGAAPTAVSVYWGPVDGTNNKSSWANTNDFGWQEEGAWLTTNVALTPHTTYYYRFYATNTAGEDSWALGSTNFFTPELPVVTTNNGATAVDAFTAVLNGSLTAGVTAAVFIYWGTNASAWSCTNNLGTRAEGPFTNAVSGLTPSTPYFYQCFVSNTVGTAWSEIAAFTTLTLTQPAITNTGASAVDTYSAMLNGDLTAGVAATIVVYWGTNSSAWSWTNNLGNRSEGAFSTSISGLTAATPYFYRCFATNTMGPAWSEIVPFTTRLAPTRFSGGGYDGYDRGAAQTPIPTPIPGTIFTVY